MSYGGSYLFEVAVAGLNEFGGPPSPPYPPAGIGDLIGGIGPRPTYPGAGGP